MAALCSWEGHRRAASIPLRWLGNGSKVSAYSHQPPDPITMATSDPKVATPIALPLFFFFFSLTPHYPPPPHSHPPLFLRSPSLFFPLCTKGKRSSQSDWAMSQTTTKACLTVKRLLPGARPQLTYAHTQKGTTKSKQNASPSRFTSATTSVAQNGGHFELPFYSSTQVSPP